MNNFTIDLKTTLSKAKQKVIGWANVSTVNGQRVIDQKGNHIPIDVLKAGVADFMLSGGRVNFNHESMDAPQRGTVAQSLVLNADMAQALGIQADREGWLVEIDVTDADAWSVVESGLITGLSLGGSSRILTGQKEQQRLANDPTADAKDVRLVTELSIQELSLVFAPANQFSDVTMILSNERATMNQEQMNKRVEELLAQVTQLSTEKQELELKLSAYEKPKAVEMTTELALSSLPQDAQAVIKAELAKADEAKKQLDAIKHEQALSDAKAELPHVDDEDKKTAIALGLLQAGEHRAVLVKHMQALADKVEKVQEATALKLGAMPKGKKDMADEPAKTLDDVKKKMKGLA